MIVVGTQVPHAGCRSGMLLSQSTTVRSQVPVMCGAMASRCGRCIHLVTSRMRTWQAVRFDLSSLV